MAKYKCKMCGAPLDVTEGQTVVSCDFCQSKQTVANANDERKEILFNRANFIRTSCDFDKAILSYQSILSIFPNEPEAYWGLCLCKYGIEYVDDPVTKNKIPTIHRVSYDSILKDSDYLAALTYADAIAKEEYQEEAKQIADIQKNILSISQKEEPFDIFICYKETTETGKRTRDSVLAQEVYSNLTDKGYKVFFSRITLESKLGSMYEPYIFAALNSAKIMLVFGTKKEYFEAIWVKNEWSRFIDMMKTRPDHYLIPCYLDMDAYEMPEQFLAFQGQDMSKLGFMQDLLRGVDKIMGRIETPKVNAETKIIQSDVNIIALLKRAEILIGDGDFKKADEVLENVLNNDPTNSQAYLFKLLIDFKLNNIEQLKMLNRNIENNKNFKKAYNFGDNQQKTELNLIVDSIKNRNPHRYLNGNVTEGAMILSTLYKYSLIQYAFDCYSSFLLQTKIKCQNNWLIASEMIQKHEFPKNISKLSDIVEWNSFLPQFNNIINDKSLSLEENVLKKLEKQHCYEEFYSGKREYQYAQNRDMNIIGITKSLTYKNTIRSSDGKFKKYVKDITLPYDILTRAKEHNKTGVKYNWVACVLKPGFFKNSFEDRKLYEFRVQECVEFVAKNIKEAELIFNKAVNFLNENFNECKNIFIDMSNIADDLDHITPIPLEFRSWSYMVNLTNLASTTITVDENISLEELLIKRDKIISINNSTSLDALLGMKSKVLINLDDVEKQKVEYVYELFEKLHKKIIFCKNIRG
ncbi:MAG: toll/interleukin-1 receptor domain-containing protein [Bacilli bacterium]|nr:toll/interleukin-1 receptor domain-containing protein [Mollicutes bacterium]MDD7549410.1 toll/interleukin-1 receptor domain-containing protein [Bacilli bacterium]MDY3761792.1 toll/interleukin-1 receptor domain-containing protein [Candidatus Onthovivens sp.]MCI7225345.1 toll/interleukin-1 receptor domain-containing protein [Mollicutes bacterium]MCI7797692.1 toll/interleukin-1 receptor domain-containing protein [Mollicutes bacterium]